MHHINELAENPTCNLPYGKRIFSQCGDLGMGTEIRINLLFCRYTICNVRNVIGGQRYTSEHDKKQSLTNKIRPICSDKQKEISNDSNKNSQQYREKTIKSNNKTEPMHLVDAHKYEKTEEITAITIITAFS